MAKLLTQTELQHRGFQLASYCSLCKAKTEDISHIFCRCHYSAWVWQVCRLKLGLKRKSDFCLHLEAAQLGQVFKGRSQVSAISRVAFSACIWHLWGERNRRIFEAKELPKDRLILLIVIDVGAKINASNLSEKENKNSLDIIEHWGCNFTPKSSIVKTFLWEKLPPQWLKLYTDGFTSRSCSGIGGIIRNKWGDPVLSYSKQLPKEDIYLIELRSILMGILHLYQTSGSRRIWIETNSKIWKDWISKLVDPLWRVMIIISNNIFAKLNSFLS